MAFNFYNSIILAGIVQGITFAAVVMTGKKYRATTTLLLAGFILSFSLDNLQYYLEDIGLITELDLLQYYFIPYLLLSGPLFLLYALHMIDPQRKLSKRDRWYFLPFIACLSICLGYKILAITGNLSDEGKESLFEFEYILEIIGIVYDGVIAVFLLYRLRKILKEKTDVRLIRPELSWLYTMLLILFAIEIIWVFVTIADYGYDQQYWHILYLGMSVLIYLIGYTGIYKYGIYEERKKIRNYSVTMSRPVSGDRRVSEHVAKLKDLLVNQRRFLDPTISLEQVADQIGVSKSHLSRLINSEMEMGFNDFLNSLRVEEAKSYLEHPDFANYTLLAIGLEAGFNSKTTFNNAFRKITGQTPSEYRNSLSQN